jgi:hypothetical protein
MTKEQIAKLIDKEYESRRAFISHFNKAAGEEALNESQLSHQLAGKIGLTKAWRAAYAIFFKRLQE